MKKSFLISLAIGLFLTLSAGAAMAELSASPSGYDFGGDVADGQATASQTFTITNPPDGASVIINSVSLGGTNDGQFSYTSYCPETLPADTTCTVDAAFNPTTTGVKNAELIITYDTTSTLSIPIAGTGVEAGDVDP